MEFCPFDLAQGISWHIVIEFFSSGVFPTGLLHNLWGGRGDTAMTKHILIPTDGSDLSNEAIQ
jgi:hypothetical protein